MQKFCVTSEGHEVIRGNEFAIPKDILLMGNYDECLNYMRNNDDWDYLRHCSISREGKFALGMIVHDYEL